MRPHGPVDTDKLATVFRRYPDVSAVYLFGSMATGTSNPTSDIDLAIIPKSERLRTQKLELLADLADEGFDEVDLVILDQDDVFLSFTAIAPNALIYADQAFDRGVTYSNAVRKYLDMEPYLRKQRQEYKRRNLKNGR
jgi:predicted nucleotidyltransferase